MPHGGKLHAAATCRLKQLPPCCVLHRVQQDVWHAKAPTARVHKCDTSSTCAFLPRRARVPSPACLLPRPAPPQVTRVLTAEEEEKIRKQIWMIDGQARVLDKLLGRRKKKKSFEYEIK